MRFILITAALALSGCTTAEHIRGNPVILDQVTNHSSADVAQCFAERYRERPWRVIPRTTETGRELVLQFETNTVKPIVAVIEIISVGGDQRVVGRARHMDAAHIKASLLACV